MSRKPVMLQLDALDCALLANALKLCRTLRKSPLVLVLIGVKPAALTPTPDVDAREAHLEKILEEGALEASKANPS